MSIPPLVCSTPPPPEQCEDDKDHDDFDLQYQLPQDDDDDENYDYTSFSSYNFQPETYLKKVEARSSVQKNGDDCISKTSENIIINDNKESQDCNELVNKCNTNEPSENQTKLKCDEDTNIEDLNLIIDKETICHNVEDEIKETPIDDDENSVQNVNIPCIKSEDNLDEESGLAVASFSRSEPVYSNDTVENDLDCKINLRQEKLAELPNTSVKLDQVTEQINKEIYNTVANRPEQLENVILGDDFVGVLQKTKILECSPDINVEQVKEEPSKPIELIPDNNNELVEEPVISESDEDFGDFDDFQSTNLERKCSTLVDDFQDPWCNEDPCESDFGNFTANFDTETQSPNSHALETTQIPNSNQLECDADPVGSLGDDFGDFDDFKYSNVESRQNAIIGEDTYQEVPVFNWSSSDNEPLLLDTINKVLISMFDEEIIQPECEFEGKLESLLSETWGHLMEIDVRQPYIVNWNNSLAQKTLLKSLCIDSRNILFGPKWSYNMPKYAANLCAAPLQPQRQTSSDTGHSEHMSNDKSASKTSTWGDPLTSEGQDSCNSNQTPATEPSPADLHVFEEVLSTENSKVYSNTLNMQPICQISLPDTHIFTPSDSETPRSKTIHYDSGPPVLLPQPVIESSKIHIESLEREPSNSIPTNNVDDSECWEFQDFKGTSNINIPNQLNQQTQPSGSSGDTTSSLALQKTETIGFQSQLLQPVKLDPIMPTLNWPDPGEVKETFDDFSDFVSNSSWPNEKPISVSPDKTVNPDSVPVSDAENTNNLTDSEFTKHKSEVAISGTNDAFDDEFDTFKCALPVSINKTNVLPAQSTLHTTLTKVDFECSFPKFNVKSDSISFLNETKLSEASSTNTRHISNTSETVTKPHPTLSSGLQILQPITACSTVTTQNQQKAGQILQPLSLESYSQINWPSPGIDLQDLSRFNPVETLQSLKTDLSAGNLSKHSSPVHSQRNMVTNQVTDDDGWGEFVSSKPKQQQTPLRKSPAFADDDEWTEFVSSPSVMPQNGLNTISLNVHTSSNKKSANQNKFNMKNNQVPVDIPTLNYITPKASNQKTYNDRHFQNL